MHVDTHPYGIRGRLRPISRRRSQSTDRRVDTRRARVFFIGTPAARDAHSNPNRQTLVWAWHFSKNRRPHTWESDEPFIALAINAWPPRVPVPCLGMAKGNHLHTIKIDRSLTSERLTLKLRQLTQVRDRDVFYTTTRWIGELLVGTRTCAERLV